MRPFEGIKVADFTWAVAGPFITRYLADFGATVVKIETATNPDSTRLTAPFKDGIPGIDRGCYPFFASNKYSLALNLNHPRAVEVTRRLVSWSDVVAEGFVPGVMERWGLDYDSLRKIKPDIIMLRTSNLGQTGPEAKQPGYGYQLTGLAGFPRFVGWPDRGPLPLPVSYTDILPPRFGATALIAALEYRQRTGKGQCLDLSQLEASLQFLSPAILDYTTNGRQLSGQVGNSCPFAAPHAVYRSKGAERWCAIAVFSDQEWQAFCKVMGTPSWTKDPKFNTLLGRKRNEEELDKLVEEWTIRFPAEEMMVMLQAVGVPAGVVQNAQDLLEDPHLKDRAKWQTVEHKVIGPYHPQLQPFELSETPLELRMPAPCLGEHTYKVCTEFLGMADEEFTDLFNDGVLD